MMRSRLIATLAMLAFAGDAQGDVRRVWAIHDGEKVERDARDHPLSAGNTTWDGRVVRLHAARNEVIAFQVIVEADAAGVKELSLRLPALISKTDRIEYRGPADDPTDYVGRPIQIFALNYMSVHAVARVAMHYYEQRVDSALADEIWSEGDREHA